MEFSKWKQTYEKKVVSADKAVSFIKSGDHVVIHHAAGEPRTLIEEMVKRKDLENVSVSHMAAIGPAEYAQPGMEKHFRHNAFFAGAATREAIREGRADYTCVFFHELPKVYREYLPVDVALIHVSPPTKQGYVSLGISVDYTKHIAQTAKTVIAQVNEEMPVTYGESFIHISDIDYIVESTRPLIEVPRPIIGPVEKAIGEHIATLVEDGSTLQLGIGAIPDATLLFLKDKKDLGIHTEMFSDGVMDLVEAGVITGKAKNLHPGKLVCAFLMGTSELYRFVHENPMVEMHTIDYTNDPCVIGRLDKMVSINSAIQVDIMGQVNADNIGYNQFSAVGGQVDFIRGAARSKGGKAIIALRSTAVGNTVSRIVPSLDEGALVTTSRYDVQYVVTEYGIADLRYRSNRERAKALIGIAHPNFRDALEKEARKRNLV